jgi:hypothetical protein
MLIVVVFPAPFGPRSPKISLSDVKAQSVYRRDIAKSLDQILDDNLISSNGCSFVIHVDLLFSTYGVMNEYSSFILAAAPASVLNQFASFLPMFFPDDGPFKSPKVG